MQIDDTLCCKMNLSISRGMGTIHILYPAGEPKCGRCLLCVLLLQIPANEKPAPPETESGGK